MQRVVPAAEGLEGAGASGRVPRVPARVQRALALLRPLPLVLLLVWLAQRGTGAGADVAGEADAARALSRALADKKLEADPAEVVWVDRPPGALGSRFREPRALVRAHSAGEPADIYLTTVRMSPEGRLLELTGVYNLSDTSAVDERDLVVHGEHAAWTIAGGGKTYSVHLADLHGEPLPRGPEWTRLARFQQSITNLQETGQRAGIARRSFKLDPAANKATTAFTDAALLIDADGRKIRIPTDGDGPIEGQHFLREQEYHAARPGNFVTWAVDRVRALPWFGSDRMQLVKAVAFAGLDWVQRFVGTVTGDDGSSRVADELGDLMNAPLAEFTDPETGWPPAPMEPMLSPALEGEGKWRPLDKDPFVLKNPGAPSPFVTSFIRTDHKRAYSQIFVMMWDPRQVALHAMSGTVEPKSATGETGPGIVPRKPEVLGRLLAGFNGGFQATHGEFGMMADGVVYLPPKPYAATVAELSNGDTGFGTWPNDDKVPDDIVSFRQNMTPLVMDGTINPYKRAWWGGVPPGWTDESRTVRSGVCMTKEHFAAYFYGSSIDADHLAFAMQRARCVYGIHLDMNPGHTGLELYRTGKTGTLPDVGHKLDPQWEATGPVPDMPGYSFIGRRMLRYMGLMNFPRYINREARDFFYLTLRHVLPGDGVPTAVKPAEPKEGTWQVKGLPQHGWPYAVATTWVRPDAKRHETKVRLLELDPRTVRAGGEGPVVATVAPAGDGALGLWLDARGATIADGAPTAGAKVLARGSDGAHPPAKTVAAVGVDGRGMVLYALVSTAPEPAADGALLNALLGRLGCTRVLLLSEPLGLALGGDRDLSGHPVAQPKGATRLVRKPAPGAVRIFEDTPIVAAKEWYPLQAKRVRYFRKPKPAEPAEGAGGGDAPATPEGSASP